MRVSEDRYWRDLRRLDLAVRMLHLEARVGTISTWTGLTADRVRTLARSLAQPDLADRHPQRATSTDRPSRNRASRAGTPRSMPFSLPPASVRDASAASPTGPTPAADRPRIIRHRGQSPRQLAYFSRSVRTRLDAATLASFLVLFEVIPKDPVPHAARRVPAVLRGLALCAAYEAYRTLIPTAELTFEYAALLTVGLAAAEELTLATCSQCGVLLVIDPLAKHRDQCLDCNPRMGGTLAKIFHSRTRATALTRHPGPGQLPLFVDDSPDHPPPR
jgi:hypothetical protein